MRIRTTSFLVLFATLGFLVAACTGAAEQATPDDQPRLVFETATADPRDLTLRDVRDAAEREGLGVQDFNTFERSDDGITIRMISPKVVEIGQTRSIFVDVANVSENYKPEKPFSVSQTSAQIIPGGPIRVSRPAGVDNSNSFMLEPGRIKAVFISVTCQSAGPASVTYQSVGLSEIESPAIGYSLTSEASFECVEDTNLLTNAEFNRLTDGALGFSANFLDWVTFDEGGVILRVNKIAPVELGVGESVDIYADFDARAAANYTGDSAEPERLTDGEIDFTSGGPVTIDSSPRQVALPFAFTYEESAVVFWGFRSGTLECTEVGEGVYHANLRGARANGDTVLQTVSGLVDCVEPSDDGLTVADQLDFSGAWARKASPGSAYVPTGRDDFPGNTELYFDRQLCVARIQGIRACDVAYWVYGADWFELTKSGNATRSEDPSGNEIFVTEYTGVYQHTHSYLQETEVPDDLLRNGKSWGTAWDLGAGLTPFSFPISGTITFSPNVPNSLQVSLQGEYAGELPYTHASKITISYNGPLPENGSLPFGVSFTEEIRRPEHAPEGMFQGIDRAFTGAFYSASVNTDGVITGTVRPASEAEKIDRATVELFLPGEDTAFATTGIDANGLFTFTGLKVVRTDDADQNAPDVFATQYRVRVSEAEAEVDGNTILFQSWTRSVRPFSETEILLQPTPATHFIAVGDRGVGGTPVAFHYSLEYWVCGGRFAPLHDSDGFTPAEIVTKCRELDPRAQPRKLGAVELLARMDWEVWAGVDDLVGSGRSWIQESVWIAEIMYEGISATDLMPIYAGTEGQVEEKWAEIIDLAENYAWAEQSGFADAGFTQWPVSMYDPLGTNSNTFIRFLVTASGLQMTEMDGLHPGHPVPVQNTQSDLGRLLTFYPEHTPWTGSAIKPEPSGSPP